MTVALALAINMLNQPAVTRFTNIYENWPLFLPGIECRYFSSFDRTGRNDDGFRGTYSSLYTDQNGEHVIFDAEGPGCLYTLWFTSETSGHGKLNLGKVRFYFDGESKPSIDIEANDLFSGTRAPFLKSIVFDNKVSTGGFVSFLPLPYHSSLKITTENRAFFYIAQYDTFPPGTNVKSGVPNVSKFPEPESKGLFRIPLNWSLAGSGTIERIVYKPSKSDLPAARIRIWWDEAEQPQIDCPVSMFFGSGLGDARIEALAFAMEAGVWENRIPMPFWRHARIELQGSGELAVQLSKTVLPPGSSGHLCASYVEQRPTTPGEDFPFLEAAGAGKLVATVLTIRPPSPTSKQWWEGDLRCYLNGSNSPAMHGTGHEDDHFGGWSNEFFDAPFTLPMHGEPKVEMLDRSGQYNGNVTLYRVWAGVGFVNGIRHSIEHGSENSVQANYSATTFWYRYPQVSAKQTDYLDVCDEQSRKAHNLKVQNESEAVELKSAYEGREYRKEVSRKVRSHLNAMSFEVDITPNSIGVLLRKQYDQFHGRQRARVLVNDRFVGWWYIPEENRSLRWAERDFYIPEKFLADASNIRVVIDPPAGSPLWSVSSYRVISVARNGDE